LTRLYCLLAKSTPKPDEIAALVAKEAMPASLEGAEFMTPLPSRSDSFVGRVKTSVYWIGP
jgi:hypothetical protein